MLATVIEGNLKAPFFLATTSRCRGLLHFSLDTYLLMLIVKQGGIKSDFMSLFMNGPAIEPRSLGPMANTLPTRYIVLNKAALRTIF